MSQVAPVDKMSVAIAIILSIIFLVETLTPKMATGAVMIITGTIILIIRYAMFDMDFQMFGVQCL